MLAPIRERLDLFAAWATLRQPPSSEEFRPELLRIGAPATPLRIAEISLQVALSIMGATRGNVQLVDPATGLLWIATHAGFDDQFLEHFEFVAAGEGSACARAADSSSQVVIPDVERDDRFAPHREIARSSKFRSVVSTPIVDGQGRLLGIVSTHVSRPNTPSTEQLAMTRQLTAEMAKAFFGSTMASHRDFRSVREGHLEGES